MNGLNKKYYDIANLMNTGLIIYFEGECNKKFYANFDFFKKHTLLNGNSCSNIIKKSFNNQKRDPKKVLETNNRKEDLEGKKAEFKREIMTLFLQMDALKEQMQSHKLMYNEMEKKLLQKMSKQNKIIVKYEDKITEMEKKIRKIRRDIDSNVLTLYDKKRQKNIVVMSKVIDGKCSQCGFKLDEELIDNVSNQKIVECPCCARILYLEEEIEENID